MTPLEYATPDNAAPGRGFWRLLAAAAAAYLVPRVMNYGRWFVDVPLSVPGSYNFSATVMAIHVAIALASAATLVLAACVALGVLARPRALAVAAAVAGFAHLVLFAHGLHRDVKAWKLDGGSWDSFSWLPQSLEPVAGLAVLFVAFWHPAARAALRRRTE